MTKKITFLGIETSCDETAAAVIRENDNGTADILSNIVSSQIEEHKKFGGVVPELAARAHLENIEYIIDKALKESKMTIEEIDGVAATAGPGLDRNRHCRRRPRFGVGATCAVVAGVGVGGRVVRDVDCVDVRLKPVDGFGNCVEITTVHGRELRGHDRSFAGGHQIVEGTHYSDPFHPVGVLRSVLLTRFIHDESPARELFTGARRCPISSRHDCGSSGRFSARWFAFTHTHCISGLTSQAPSTPTPPHGPLRSCLGQFMGHDMPVSDSAH